MRREGKEEAFVVLASRQKRDPVQGLDLVHLSLTNHQIGPPPLLTKTRSEQVSYKPTAVRPCPWGQGIISD